MTSPDPVGVHITPRDIYDALIRLDATVNRMVSRGDDHTAGIADHEARVRVLERVDVVSDVKDHEERIRVLERARWPLPALAVLVSIGAIAVAIIPLIR